MVAEQVKRGIELPDFGLGCRFALPCEMGQEAGFQKTIGSIPCGADCKGSDTISAASFLPPRESRKRPAFLCSSFCLVVWGRRSCPDCKCCIIHRIRIKV